MSNQDPARQIAERVARRLAGDSSVPQTTRIAANGDGGTSQRPGARVINFISPNPPARTQPSIERQTERQSTTAGPLATFVPQGAQPPGLAPFARAPAQANAHPADHPSQERF